MQSESDTDADMEVSACPEGYRSFNTEGIKATAEMNGIANVNEEAASLVSEHVTFLIKLVVQQSSRFMDKNNHLSMTIEDVELGMKTRGVEPVFGFISHDTVLFKHGRGGGKDFYFTDEKELKLTDIINSPMPKIPIKCSIKKHWLAIDGVQPAVPENPAQRKPKEYASNNTTSTSKAKVPEDFTKMKSKLITSEKVHIKDSKTHELSLEQQFYLKEITEACVGADESRRGEALESLRVDTGLTQMLPRLCNFITEGVKINTVQNNLALLIYLNRMCKALVDNQNLCLEPYLHELIPSIITCIVSRQLCLRPTHDNHWVLREFAARLLCQICRTFSTSANQLQSRITKLLTSTLENDSAPFATHYGAIFCLGELGTEAIKAFIFPQLQQISQRLSSVLDNSMGMLVVSTVDKAAAENILSALLKILPPVMRQVRHPPDLVEDYRVEYGAYLGPLLHSAVIKLRQQQTPSTPSAGQFTHSSFTKGPSFSQGLPRTPLGPTSQVIRASPAARNPSLPLPGSAFLSTSGNLQQGNPTAQKVLLITSQPRLPSSVSTPSSQPITNSSTPHFVRLIPAGSSNQSTSNLPPTPNVTHD